MGDPQPFGWWENKTAATFTDASFRATSTKIPLFSQEFRARIECGSSSIWTMFVCAFHHTCFLLSLHRPSMLLTLSILRTKNAYSNFKGYVALRRGYHYCTSLVLLPWSPLPIEPLLGLMKPSTKRGGKALGFVPKN